MSPGFTLLLPRALLLLPASLPLLLLLAALFLLRLPPLLLPSLLLPVSIDEAVRAVPVLLLLLAGAATAAAAGVSWSILQVEVSLESLSRLLLLLLLLPRLCLRRIISVCASRTTKRNMDTTCSAVGGAAQINAGRQAKAERQEGSKAAKAGRQGAQAGSNIRSLLQGVHHSQAMNCVTNSAQDARWQQRHQRGL
jgi:hypothetical protein